MACFSLTFLCHPYLGISVSIRVNAIPWHCSAIPQQLISPLCKALPPHFFAIHRLCSSLGFTFPLHRTSIPSFSFAFPNISGLFHGISFPFFSLALRCSAFPFPGNAVPAQFISVLCLCNRTHRCSFAALHNSHALRGDSMPLPSYAIQFRGDTVRFNSSAVLCLAPQFHCFSD